MEDAGLERGGGAGRVEAGVEGGGRAMGPTPEGGACCGPGGVGVGG
jgi:hypothetical protein